MARQKIQRDGSGGTSQYHQLVTRGRTLTRTYKMSSDLVEDIAELADTHRVSSNDLAHWLLEEAVALLKEGAIKPKLEPIISRCVRS